jgi:hypothetical protein
VTRLEKQVRRVVPLDGDQYVVTLVAGETPLIEFRQLRRRTALTLPLEHVLYQACRKQAEQLRAARKTRRLRSCA